MKIFNKKYVSIIAGSALLLIILFGGYDLKISGYLYDPDSLLGIFLAGYGSYPIMLASSVAGIMLINSREKPDNFRLYYGILVIVISYIYLIKSPMDHMEGYPLYISGIVATILTFGSCYVTDKLTKDCDKHDLLKYSLIILVFAISELAIINLIKYSWPRMRYRTLVNTSEDYYRMWYQYGGDIRKRLLEIPLEEFKSFPSLHTANATAIFFLLPLSMAVPKLNTYRQAFHILIPVWIFITGVSRIVMGAHFFSDVLWGFTISYLLFALSCYLVRKRMPDIKENE